MMYSIPLLFTGPLCRGFGRPSARRTDSHDTHDTMERIPEEFPRSVSASYPHIIQTPRFVNVIFAGRIEMSPGRLLVRLAKPAKRAREYLLRPYRKRKNYDKRIPGLVERDQPIGNARVDSHEKKE